jgi:hypothetical protein
VWSLVTKAESNAVAAAAAADDDDDDCSGDCGMVGVAARGSDAEGAAGGGSVAIEIALSGAAGLFISTAIARVEVESGVGA